MFTMRFDMRAPVIRGARGCPVFRRRRHVRVGGDTRLHRSGAV